MHHWILCASLLLCSPAEKAASAFGDVQIALAQQPTPNTNPDNRDEIKAATDKLSGHIGKRGKEDTEAISVIDTLVQEFEKSGPKDRSLIAKTLDKCFEQKRQESAEGVRDNKLYMAAAVSLRTMGPESAPVLMKWISSWTTLR